MLAGGELVRIAFLAKNNVPAGKAAWVTTMEIIADVFVGTILAFIAGFNALFVGATFIGILLILIALPTFKLLVFYINIFFKEKYTIAIFFIKNRKKIHF